MKQKIISLFSKAYSKLFRKKNRGTIFTAGDSSMTGTLSIDPELFRRMFAEAYPDAAKFIESIHEIKRKPEFYLDNGGIACDGFVSARGLKTDNFSTGYCSEKGRNGR